MSARAPASLGTAVLASALLAACGLVLDLPDRRLDETSHGPVGPGGACETPGDCPVAGNACFVRTCTANVCGLADATAGALVASQKEGDCRQVVCDDKGNAVEVDDNADTFDDGRECTKDVCVNGKPTHAPDNIGKGCGAGKICNDVGGCVECLDDDDCSTDGSLVCDADQCVPNTCKDGAKGQSETDIDCGGGLCSPCTDGLACEEPADCQSGVCMGSACQAPSCTDGVKNGTESDVDCGSACPTRCADGGVCAVADDCVNGVCGPGTPPTCLAATCVDGVKNGDELDVDCGGVCPPGTCDDGEVCTDPQQCQSAVCAGTCTAPTCTDGVKNGTEEGPDCGGPCPNAC